jgi:hypothetical protein
MVVTRLVDTARMGSRSAYGRTAGVVHSPGDPLVWCPKYRAKCAEHGWSFQALEVLPDQLHLRSRLSTLWSRSSSLVPPVEDVSAAAIGTIGRYITGQIPRPIEGRS